MAGRQRTTGASSRCAWKTFAVCRTPSDESIASSAVTAFPDRGRDRNVASRRMRAYCCPVALCFPFVTSNASSHASIAETVAPVALRTRFVAVALQLEEKARGDRGVGEVREHAVDAKT